MNFTMEETALIEGLIASYCISSSVSDGIRIRYGKTHRHLQANLIDYTDMLNIRDGLSFIAPLFHESVHIEKEIWTIIAKAQRYITENSPVAE